MNEENTKKTFQDLGLGERTIRAIKQKGFEEPSEIQTLCIPLLLQSGTEVVGQAQTGTGKTAAFALPILETVDENDKSVQALILTPTRELALQVSEEIASLKGDRKLEITPIYGGASMEKQLQKLKKGVQIVVGTPGRILDHIKRKTLILSKLEFMVLDEADEMLDMGFIEDIEEVLKSVPENKRMLMFSATIPPEIQKLSASFMKNPIIVRTQAIESATDGADQIYYIVRESDKIEALTRIIDRNPDFYGVVFCRTKLQCDEIGHRLQSRGYDAEALHGDLSQREREIILRKMKEKTISILVATDVAARGLDIQDLTHVINYSIPSDPEIYIHRVGRTGRAGKEGTAITLITPGEMRRFDYITRKSKADIRQEDLPSSEEVIESKKDRIIEDLTKALEKEANENYTSLASTLLDGRDERKAFASLLEYIYRDELDKSQYKDISIKGKSRKKKGNDEKNAEAVSTFRPRIKDLERPYDKVKTPSMDEKGTTRLFIARGKKDGLTKRGLIDILSDQANVRKDELGNIEVLENFSFVSAPYDTAEHILSVFKDKLYDGRAIITKAKNSEKKNTNTPPKKQSENKKKDYKKEERYREEEDFLSWERERQAHSYENKKKKSSSKKGSKMKAKSRKR